MPRNAGSLRDPGDHPVDVAAINRPPGDGAQDQRPGGALAAASLEHAQHRHGQRHRGRHDALADQVQHPVTTKSLDLVLDPDRGGF